MNLYEILEIKDDATEKEIKKAYALKLRMFPPESESEEFIKIKNAFDILSNKEKREEYDLSIDEEENTINLENEINELFENEDYKNSIIKILELLEITPSFIDYIYKLVLCYEKTFQYEDALKYARKLIRLSEKYEYKKKIFELYLVKKDYRNAVKYLKASYEMEPLDSELMYFLVDLSKDSRYYKDITQFLENQVNNYTSKTINSSHFEGLLEIYIKNVDLKNLKIVLSRIDKYTIRNDDDKIKLGLNLYDKGLKLYEKDEFFMAKLLSEKALDLYVHEDIRMLFNMSLKNHKAEKLFNEFIDDKQIINDIKDIICLYIGPNKVKNEEIILKNKNDILENIKKLIIKNPDPLVKSIKTLRFRYFDYHQLEEKVFDNILEISQERKNIYDEFSNLSYDYNICYTLRKLVSFYEENTKNEIDDIIRDELFEKNLFGLEEERNEDIVMSIKIIKEDYDNIYNMMHTKLHLILLEAKSKIQAEAKIQEELNNERQIKIQEEKIKKNKKLLIIPIVILMPILIYLSIKLKNVIIVYMAIFNVSLYQIGLFAVILISLMVIIINRFLKKRNDIDLYK